MRRTVQPELLDTLPPEDPRAQRSRRDLRRVNAWMRNSALVLRGLRTAFPNSAPKHLIELGAGDGHLLLRVARTLAPQWPSLSVTLLDQQPVVTPATLAEFASLGWPARVEKSTVEDWAAADVCPIAERGSMTRSTNDSFGGPEGNPMLLEDVTRCGSQSRAPLEVPDVVIANLFLHHLCEPDLIRLFEAVAARARCLIAVEPSRTGWSVLGSRLLGLIGCNGVTRHDAVVSVRAGFASTELSSLWPERAGWELKETRAGAFSHLFIARRKD